MKNTFPGPLIIGTFEKGAPAQQKATKLKLVEVGVKGTQSDQDK